MCLNSIFIATLWICGVHTYRNMKVHERMTPEELRQIFHVNLHEEVPEYDIVNVRSLSKRSTASENRKQLHLSAFGKTLHLNLKKNEEFENDLASMKVYEAQTIGNDLSYREMDPHEYDSDMGVTYQDEQEMAAVLVRHADGGEVQVEGTIGNNLVIKPIPQSLVGVGDSYVDDEVFLDQDEIKSTKPYQRHLSILNTTSHIVFKRKGLGFEQQNDYMELEGGHSDQRNWTMRNRRVKRKAPLTVFPEVLIVVDHSTLLMHGGDSRALKKYFVCFWNGVDLRYKTLSNPKIRITIAGMVVATDKDATPYLERNRLRPPNYDAFDAAGALSDMGKYLYRESRLPTYDVAVVITKLDMCKRQFHGGRCGRGTAGFAYVGGACVVNQRLEKVNGVAIIEDSGGFSGIIVAAHEVGHLLGCVHDGSYPPSYLGGPGASRCPWEDGYIMSDLRHTDRGFKWSPCSVEQFKHFLEGETASCLYNYPHDDQPLPRILPGSTLSLDEQCQKDKGTSSCFRDARVCTQLYCYDQSSGLCISFRPAAEGSICGHGQICRDGRCESENLIPDYTHHDPSYVGWNQNLILRRSSDSDRTTPYARRRITSGRPTPYTRRRTTVEAYLPPPPSTDFCEDSVNSLAGGLTCKEFLERYSYRYCRHRYMKQKCCRSQREICSPS